VNTVHEDLLERLQDRTRHLQTFLVAAEQAANDALTLMQQISRECPAEVEAHYDRLADAEETLHSITTELGHVMAELERALPRSMREDDG
jgi:hypothetical protein